MPAISVVFVELPVWFSVVVVACRKGNVPVSSSFLLLAAAFATSDNDSDDDDDDN